MQFKQSPLHFICRTAAVFTVAGAATLGLHAQQATPLAQSLFFVPPTTSATLLAANDAPDAIGYSSSAGAEEMASAESYMSSSLAADPAPQPPPRRYGRRPVYADSHHNADGSNKYTYYGGGGVTIPTGGTHSYLGTGYNLQVGGGRNFNKKLALLAEFDYNHLGVQTGVLNNLEAIYNAEIATYNVQNPNNTVPELTELDGNSHIWSFTLDPMYTFMDGDRFGAYVIGGVGFYHKVSNFSSPSVECNPYYGICYQANQTIDDYTSNSVGFNGGAGVTYKGSRFSDLKFYAEARYVYTDNSPRPYYDGVTGTNPTSNPNYFNVFPQNSAKTTYLPITVGIRF